ncbi:GDP-mannose 4,6-dehydratase [Patescibacteria group bacterium]|nr:GDP-mannose 4,6-dehydratase [Patescibacteria group bacterium]
MINKYWQNKNVFITGCTGLLGSWMTKHLVDQGANVTGLVRDFVHGSNLYSNGYFAKINVVKGQLEDVYNTERALGEYEIDTVFHLGAQTIVGIANRNPLSTFESNIRGTYNLLEACRRSPLIKKIVVASSDKAYGDQKKLPYSEDAPVQGKHPYDVSKSCIDLISQAYFETYKLPVCITRCGNFFGGGDLNFNRIIPETIRSIFYNKPPVIRSDGTLIRDYFYIEDAVEAYLLLAQKMDNSEIHGEAFNFSNENQITVLELVNKIIKLMNSPFKPKILNEANNEIKHQYLSAKKAKKILGWQTKQSLDDRLLQTIDWYKNFFQKNDDTRDRGK